jgi:hypothetical protein
LTKWSSLGDACIPGLTFTPVDPTGLITGGKVVLYLVNIDKLFQPVDQIIYIVTSADGLNFDMPRPIYVQSKTMVDPFVLDTQDGSFRLYTPSDKEGIISAVSSGGNEFIREKGVRMTFGGMPGALLLSNKHVRMFLSGGNDGLNGIFSMVSNDGLKFTTEKGVRIQAKPGFFVDNPQPIQLLDGSYLMLYQVHDQKLDGQPEPWKFTEIHLATSSDGYKWKTDPTIIGFGGTACVVELPDGTWLIYFVH